MGLTVYPFEAGVYCLGIGISCLSLDPTIITWIELDGIGIATCVIEEHT